MSNPVLDLARELAQLKRNVRALGSTSQLAYQSLESGAIQVFDDDTKRGDIGRQWDGTYAYTVQNGPTPPTPSDPTVADGTESIVVIWDGTFTNSLVSPMDFLRVDVHVGATSGFIPDHSNRRGTFAAPNGGAVSITLPYGTYYVKLVCWTLAGSVSAASGPVVGDAWPIEVSTDGFAPASSPAPTALSGIEIIGVRWTPIVNVDPVTYDVHISTTLGFTPDSTTLVGSTDSSSFWIKALPGADPLPGDPDARTLQYDVAYYIRVVARDADGSAAPSAQAVGSVFQVTGVNLAADSVTAENILVGSLTGELFAASVVVAGTFKSGEAGQRVEWGAAGIQGYRSDGSLILNIPTDGSNALFDGEFIIRGATITGGISIENAQNEMKANSAITLMRGITSPSATPAVTSVWDSVRPSTLTLTDAQKTGPDLGKFDLEPTAVSHIEWKPAESMWILHHIRPNGTRAWFFNPDGSPKDRYGTGTYFNDQKDWETWSTVEIYTGAKAGVYTLFRFLPSGTDWYINGPSGFNHYNRLNTGGTPSLGTNGTDFFIAEIVSGSHLRINYHSMGPDGSTLPAPSTTYESSAGFAASICSIEYSATGFDIGTARYSAAQRGVAYQARLLAISGTAIIPGGSGGWASSTLEAESWECPTSNRRGMAWDGSNFYTYGGDGLLYKHTGERWDPSTTSSTIWNGITFKDTDAAGTGTHQTMMGPLKSVTHKRRAKLQLIAPPVPDNGGLDDPDKVQWYAGRGATAPITPWSTVWAQGSPIGGLTGPALLQITTLATTGTNPPTSNSFPSATAAKIRNDDDTLVIAGDATGIKTPALIIGTTQVYAPLWIVATSTISTLTTGAFNDVTGFSFATVAGASYAIDCTMFIDNPSSSTPKWRSSWAWTGSGHLSEAQNGLDVNVVSPAYNGSMTAHALIDQTSSPVDEGTGFGTPAAIPVLARLAVTFVCTASGTLRLRHAQVTANAAASRVLYGSRMCVQRMV